MKIKTLLWPAVLLLLSSTFAVCQTTQLYVSEALPVQVTCNKTVNLVFGYPVKSVDKGSASLLAQKARGVHNVLQLKAASPRFEQTNLTVITADGSLHTFLIDYQDDPLHFVIDVVSSQSQHALFIDLTSQKKLEELAQNAANAKPHLRRIKDKKGKVKMRLTGLYVQNNMLCVRIKVKNTSSVPYRIESERFWISDQKQIKRTASQLNLLTPLLMPLHDSNLAARSECELIYVLSGFTLSDHKRLWITLNEKNGGRHLKMALSNRQIVRARPL